jgi:hypothetical protein
LKKLAARIGIGPLFLVGDVADLGDDGVGFAEVGFS